MFTDLSHDVIFPIMRTLGADCWGVDSAAMVAQAMQFLVFQIVFMQLDLLKFLRA